MSAANPSRQERWRARKPLADWAHSATKAALRRGLIERKPCEVCGDPNTDAHHGSYDQPLAVRFLCRKHHKAEHRRQRNGGGQ